jgi:glycosyltransferase involved in cell wall biosynthesis
LFSVVIPTHKRGDIVVKAVESVINSAELPEEIIVVEDRTCEAKETLSDYISEGKVQYHRKTHGVPGASATRNFGVSKANEPYVLFLDDDDTLFPDYIGKIKSYISASSCRWGFGDMSLDGEVKKYRARTTGELTNNNFKSKIAGLGMGFWISKDIYESVGGLDELLSIDEDTDLCCKLLSSGFNPLYIRENAVNVSRNDGNKRLTNFTEASRIIECYLRTLTNNYELFPDKHEARDFLLDRVHRVMCKNNHMNELYKIKNYQRNMILKMVHFVREYRYRNIN